MSRSQAPQPTDRPRSHSDPDQSRQHAREWYWTNHDAEIYECPDCGRGSDRVARFEVHHVDGDPTNNDPRNLLGLCLRCHRWRHYSGPNISSLDVEEWKDALMQLGSESGESTKRKLL